MTNPLEFGLDTFVRRFHSRHGARPHYHAVGPDQLRVMHQGGICLVRMDRVTFKPGGRAQKRARAGRIGVAKIGNDFVAQAVPHF